VVDEIPCESCVLQLPKLAISASFTLKVLGKTACPIRPHLPKNRHPPYGRLPHPLLQARASNERFATFASTMKIQITTQKPDEVQRFFSAPLTFSQKVVVKKLLIVEQILERMKALGLNRRKLAARMDISPAQLTLAPRHPLPPLDLIPEAKDVNIDMEVRCDHSIHENT
jgi:hypothetical protein